MKGVAETFIILAFGVFLFGLIFITVNEAYVGGIQDYGNDNIPIADTDARNIHTIMDTVWTYLPVAMLIIAMFAAFAYANRSSQQQVVQ